MDQQSNELETPEGRLKRDRELSLLNRAGQEFTASLDTQQVVEQLLSAATEIIGAEGASVWLWEDEAEHWLVCRAVSHHGLKCTPINLRLRVGEGVAGWVAQRREAAVVPNAQEDARFFAGVDQLTGFRTRSLLAVPLWSRDQVIGVLEVVNKREGAFHWGDRSLAETLAASAAIAIENARLVEMLRRRTVSLQVCHQQLDAFTRALTDDLRRPLSLIVSFAQTLEEGWTAMAEEDVSRHLNMIAQRGNTMIGVIDSLLTLRSKPPQALEEEIAPLDTAAIVSDVLERLAYMVEQYGARVRRPTSWPSALGHRPWVEEVWTTYISNAIKHGGKPPLLELGFDISESASEESPIRFIRFWVRDNGPGLAPEEQVRLFAPPTRLDPARETEYAMGLSLARRIVEKLGGQVGLESQPGQGSLFYFTLPAAPAVNE